MGNLLIYSAAAIFSISPTNDAQAPELTAQLAIATQGRRIVTLATVPKLHAT